MPQTIEKITAYFLFLFLFSIHVCAQSSAAVSTSYKIKFISSIESANDLESRSIFAVLSDFIFGAEAVKLSTPISVIARDSTELIVLDKGLNKLILIDLESGEFNVIDSEFDFASLVSICKFQDEKYLFTDSKKGKIYVYDYLENEISLINDSLKLIKPTGIGFVNSLREIWVSETGRHSIVVLSETGELIKRIGRRGVNENEFNFPTSIWVDKDEKVYITDALNFRIQVFDRHGDFLFMFGEQGDASGYFARPKGIATDTTGNIYVVDALFHSVQIFNPSGEYLSFFGFQGREKGNFWLPNGLFIDKKNRIYVADSYNSRIQIFQLLENKDEK